MANDFATIQGVAQSWADIALSLSIVGGASLPAPLISDFSWSETVELGVVRGTGGRKRMRTTGLVDNEASLTFYIPGWIEFRKSLAAVAPEAGGQKQIGLVVFDVLAQWTPPGETVIYAVKAVGARIIGRSMSTTEGADADKIEIPLSIMQVQELDGTNVVVLI